VKLSPHAFFMLTLLGCQVGCENAKGWEPKPKPVDPGDAQLDRLVLDDYGVIPPTLASRALAGLELVTLPSFPALRDELLIISDGDGNPYLHLLDPTSGLPAGSFGRSGEGPGEFGSWPQILKGPPDLERRTWVFDARLRRLTALGPWRIEDGPLQTPVSITIQLPAGYISNPLWTRNGELLATMRSEDPAEWGLAWFTPEGTERRRFQSFDFHDDRFALRDLASAYAFTMCQSPDRQLIAAVHRNAGAGFVISDQGTHLGALHVPIPFKPLAFRHPITRRLRFLNEPAARTAYMGCDATSDRIYAVFRGALQALTPGRSSGNESYLHVFDWSGTLRAVYRLDHGANSIVIDTTHSLAYTTTLGADGESPSVRVTQLPSGIGGPSQH
jgi:hypothetical protein